MAFHICVPLSVLWRKTSVAQIFNCFTAFRSVFSLSNSQHFKKSQILKIIIWCIIMIYGGWVMTTWRGKNNFVGSENNYTSGDCHVWKLRVTEMKYATEMPLYGKGREGIPCKFVYLLSQIWTRFLKFKNNLYIQDSAVSDNLKTFLSDIKALNPPIWIKWVTLNKVFENIDFAQKWTVQMMYAYVFVTK